MLNKIFRKSDTFVERRLLDELYIVPRDKKQDIIFVLSEDASKIWALINGKRSIAKIAHECKIEHKQLKTFFNKLIDEELIELTGDSTEDIIIQEDKDLRRLVLDLKRIEPFKLVPKMLIAKSPGGPQNREQAQAGSNCNANCK